MNYDVIVIGGGITGAGVARDAAMRGFRVLLLERRDLASGTTGACMGMLHGGLRYLLYDPEVTRLSCVESGIIQRLAPHLVFRIPWLFPLFPGAHARLYEAAMAQYDRLAPLKNSSPHVLLSAQEAREVEPGLSERIEGALSMDEPGVNPFRLTMLNVLSAAAHGAAVRNHAEVTAIRQAAPGVWHIHVRDTLTGQEEMVEAPCVVNAAGPWAPQVAALAGLSLRLRPTKGTHILFDRHVTTVAIGTGDVSILPHESTALCGLTDTFFPHNPDEARPEPDEVEYLLSHLEKALPAIRKARIIRAMAGVRPLIDQPGDDPRRLTRQHRVVDHEEEGAPGLLSVVGGKMVLYRLMAEEAVDRVSRVLSRPAPCRTAEEPLPGGESLANPHRLAEEYGLPLQVAVRLASRHGARAGEVLDGARQALHRHTYVCLCEPVTEAEVRHAVRHEWAHTLDDLRRRTRLGMGPCQGFGCTARAVAALTEESAPGTLPPQEQMRAFLQERWKGRQPVLRGLQLPQEELTRALYLGVEGLGGTDAPWTPPASLRTPLPSRREAAGRRVVVVGGGLAGAAAALAARALGAEVILVRQACGATALSSGALDWPSDLSPDAAARSALEMLLTVLAEAGLPYQGAWEQPHTAITPLGRRKRAPFLPATAGPGADGLDGTRLLVVGVRGLGGFHAPLVAQALAGTFQAEAMEITLPRAHKVEDLTPFDVARLLDEPEVAQEVRDAVAGAVRAGRFQAVLWPGVLGLERAAAVRGAWQAAWGVPVWEALGGSPSIHGWRLHQALERALRAAGVEILQGKAIGIHSQGRTVRGVDVAWRQQKMALPASAVVWATGRFVGGGLADEGSLREPVLNLPLEGAGEAEHPWSLTQEAFGELQPLFGVRVRTDPLGRPADARGEPAYANLWAAGALILGRDYADGRGLGGLCVTSGYRAGWWAACGAED